MSISITRDIEVVTDAVEVTSVTSEDTVSSSERLVDIEASTEGAVTGVKKEYSIVGDALYASVNVDETPTWLAGLIDNVVATKVGAASASYDNLAQDVRDAIASIDIANNSYGLQIDQLVDANQSIIAQTEQLNANYGDVQTTITNINTTVANELFSLGVSAAQIESNYKGYADSQITALNTALSNEIGSYATSINALASAYDDPTTGLLATANAVDTLHTYVGLDGTGTPNSLGLIADVAILKKQADGTVDIYADTHDVILNTDINDINDDEMVLTEWPYALWVPMSGTVDPVSVTRDVNRSGVLTAYPVASNTVYHNTLAGTYWVFDASTGAWSSISLAEYNTVKLEVRNQHIGDSYIKYAEDTSGNRTYSAAFKFILTAPDTTTPKSTDSDGYAWVKVVDTDAQAAYVEALKASALADGKVSSYFALKSTTNPGTAVYIYYFDGGAAGSDKLKRTIDGAVIVPSEGDQAVVKANDASGEDVYVYHFKDGMWALVTPGGLVAGSSWSVDLDAYLGGKDGALSSWGGKTSLKNEVETTSRGEIQAAFSYDAELISKTGEYYKAGFGMDVANTSGAGTAISPFTSEFWIDAERLVLKSPSNPGVQAVFNVTGAGISLGVEHTEATRNEPKGAYSAATTYAKGDLVTSDGSSYTALQASTGVAVTNTAYWQILAEKGFVGQSVDYWFKRATSTPVDAPAANGADTNGWYTDLGNAALNTSGDLYVIKGTSSDGSAWTYGSPAINNKRNLKEVSIYSDATTGTATKPTNNQSTFNFTSNTLTINNASWNLAPLTLTANNQKVYVCTALAQGNDTETSVGITWSTPSIYAQRQDGIQGPVGDTGNDGSSVALIPVYIRSSGSPATPSGGSYDFGTKVLTTPASWFSTIPAGSDPVYISYTTATVTGSTGVDSTLFWTSPSKLVENGVDGTSGTSGVDGLSTLQATVYRRLSSTPPTPTGGTFNFGTNVLTPPTNWSKEIPAGTDPVYACNYQFSIVGDTATDTAETWSTPAKVLADGIDGTDGLSTYYYSVYKRSVSAPATPTGGSYNFGTNSGIAPSGWSTSVPTSDGNPLYVSSALASVQGTTGTDNTLSWGAPTVLAQDGSQGPVGDTGNDGSSVALIPAYRRSSSAPSTPTGGSYNFGTKALTPPSLWTALVPAGTDPVYVTYSTASVPGSTGVDSTLTWSAPVLLVKNGINGTNGTNGTNGAAGLSTFQATVYRRSASAPATPSGGSFNFGTNILTPPTNWVTSIPAGTDPVYACNYQFSITGDTGTDTAGSWSTPAKALQNGAAGANGLSTYYYSVYRRLASAPSTPAGGSYNFGTNTGTAPTNWSNTVPAANGNPVYISGALASVQGTTGTDSTLTWSTPTILAQDGAAGGTGPTGARGTAALTASYTNATYNVAVTALSSAQVAALWNGAASINYQNEIVGDTLIVTNTSTGVNGGTHIYEYISGAWTAANTFTVNGNQIVDGTLVADAIGAGTITASVNMNALAFNGGSMNINNNFMVDALGNVDARSLEIRTPAGALIMSSGSGMSYNVLNNLPTLTKAGLGLNYTDGADVTDYTAAANTAQSKVDARLSSGEKANISAGKTPDGVTELRNSQIGINADGTLSGAGSGQINANKISGMDGALIVAGQDNLWGTSGYSRYEADATTTSGTAFKYWQGWTGTVYFNSASGIQGLVRGKTYRIFARVKKTGSPVHANYGIYNGTKAVGVSIIGGGNFLTLPTPVTTSYQVVDMGKFTHNWDASDVTRMWFGSSGMSAGGVDTNSIMIDWMYISPIDVSLGADVTDYSDSRVTNTGNFTGTIQGTSATTVRDRADTGFNLTQSNGTTIHSSSVSGIEIAGAKVGGQAPESVTGAQSKANTAAGIIADGAVVGGGAANLIVNGDMLMVGSDGRPAGVKAHYSNSNPATISYEDTTNKVMRLYSAGDTGIGACWPAFRVNHGSSYKIRVRLRASGASASGLYIRMSELNSELATGNTHVGEGTHEAGVHTFTTDSASGTMSPSIENAAMPTTATIFTSTYTPRAAAVWASLSVLNWTAQTGSLFVEAVEITQITTVSTLGAETPTNAQSKVDSRLSSTEKTNLAAGKSTAGVELRNSQITIGSNGALSGGGGGAVTIGGIGGETPAGAQNKADTAKDAAKAHADAMGSNLTLYTTVGVTTDIMPTGSPLPKGFSRTSNSSHYSDYIPVMRGEKLYWDMWARQTGSTARAYMGIERFDRNKKPIAGNSGCVYSGLANTMLSTTWTKYTGSHTLPVSHTAYGGSDGAEVCFVRVRLLFNYQTTGQAYYSGYRLYRHIDKAHAGLPNVVDGADKTADNVGGLSATLFPTGVQNSNTTKADVGLPNVVDGADKTADNVAASVAGQGDLATLNKVNGTYIDALSVNTVHIKGQSVTFPEFIQGPGSVGLPAGSAVLVQSLYFTIESAGVGTTPILLTYSLLANVDDNSTSRTGHCSLELTIEDEVGNVVATILPWQRVVTTMWLRTYSSISIPGQVELPNGSYVAQMRASNSITDYGNYSPSCSVGYRSIAKVELKR